MKTKIRAPASWGPTREMALLMADPRPALCTGTEVISAVVNGATSIMMPTPKITAAGRKSMKYERGGTYVPASPGTSFHGWLLAGTRTYQSTPRAMITGPAAMKNRGPYFAARRPKRGEPKIKKREPGMPAAPAAA